MNVLILENFFYRNEIYVSKYQAKFLNYLIKIKLRKLCDKLKKESKEPIHIKIITNRDVKFYIDKNIDVESLSEYRMKIDRLEFLNLKKKIVRYTKKTQIKLYQNLLGLGSFHLNGVFIGKVLEFRFMRFFKFIFGEFELLKRIIKTNSYDKIVCFNCNPYAKDLFQYLNLKYKKIEIYTDEIYKWSIKLLKIYSILKENFYSLAAGIKNYWFRRSKLVDLSEKKSIIFLANSKNQINSVKEVYSKIKKDEKFNLIQYRKREFIIFKKFSGLIKKLSQLRNLWFNNLNIIFQRISYDSIKLDEIAEEFFEFEILLFFIKIYNSLCHFERLIKFKTPSLVIITNDVNKEGRFHAKYCRINNIPTLYIPHAAHPIDEEIITKTDVSFMTVWGEADKKYFINKGEKEDKIKVVGTPRYNKLYKGKVKQLTKITDMFNKQRYKFNSKKQTILLTTNPISDNSNEKILKSVISCLKELNMVNNLVIKLHPAENGKIHKKVIEDLSVKPIIVKDYDILELIKSCDLLISRLSTTILEAMVIGTPVILLDNINLDFYFTGKYSFIDEEKLITARNEHELIENIKLITHDKNFAQRYKDDLKNIAENYNYYDLKESPTTKIIKLIYNIIEEET
ncbi:MAG: UDP-N-acetylglucosamine 2-epimerase [Candidatus Thorarchaeota archaeon]